MAFSVKNMHVLNLTHILYTTRERERRRGKKRVCILTSTYAYVGRKKGEVRGREDDVLFFFLSVLSFALLFDLSIKYPTLKNCC